MKSDGYGEGVDDLFPEDPYVSKEPEQNWSDRPVPPVVDKIAVVGATVIVFGLVAIAIALILWFVFFVIGVLF